MYANMLGIRQIRVYILLVLIGQVIIGDAIRPGVANGTGLDLGLLVPILLGDITQLPIILINLLKGQIAGNDACAQDSRHVIDGLAKLEMWALQMIDASGKPQRNILQGSTTWFGSYDDCLKIHHTFPQSKPGYHGHEITGAYAKISIHLPQNLTGSLLPPQMFGGVSVLRWDVCVPNSCSAENISRSLNRSKLASFTLSIQSVEIAESRSIKGDTGAYVSIGILVACALLCVVGTVLDLIHDKYTIVPKFALSQPDKDLNCNGMEFNNLTTNGVMADNIDITISNGKVPITDALAVETGELKPKAEENNVPSTPVKDVIKPNILNVQTPTRTEENMSLCYRLLMAFSVRANGKKILDCSSPSGTLGCLHGIRVLSMAWIVLGHFIGQIVTEVENKRDVGELKNSFWFQCVLNGTLSVDSFFILSGLLVSYLFLREVSKHGKITLKQMGLFYFHRFWRLTPLYMMVIMIYTNLTKYFADGPRVNQAIQDMSTDPCKKYWWTNLLYINNLYKTDTMCMGWTWYLANDMQLYAVSPLAIIPLALGYRVIGLLVLAAMFVTHIVYTGIVGHDIGYPGHFFSPSIQRYLQEVYYKPYARIGIYSLGLLLGYVLHITKCKKRFSKPVLLIGSVIAAMAGLLSTYITYDNYRYGGNVWSSDAYVAFDTLFRPAWGIALFWLIFMCVHGYGGVVNDILAWKAWIPLSRLTYATYLVHLIVRAAKIQNMRGYGYMNAFYIMNGFIGLFAVSYAVSFILALLIEAPCIGLEKILIKK